MDLAPSVDEIDLSDQQSFQLVLKFLEKHASQSLSLWQFLRYIEQNLVKKEYLRPYQLLVNDREDIKCVLFMNCSVGFKCDYDSLSEEEKYKERRVAFFCEEKDDELLLDLIKHYLPWSKIKDIIFSSIPQRFSPLIQSFVHQNHLGQCEIHPYQQMELDRATFAEKSPNISSSHSSDIDVRPLSISDASIVDDNWTFKSELSLARIQYEIAHIPAFGAYRNNELLSWALTKYDASVGSVFTKPEARGLGLGTITNLHVASKLLETQERTFCFVAHDNIASIKMVEKLGYHQVFDVDWLIFTSN